MISENISGDIKEKVDRYMKDLNTNEPAIREIIRDTIIENRRVLEEDPDNVSITAIFLNSMEDVDTGELFDIYVFRTIQTIKSEGIEFAMLRDVLFNYERREITIEFSELDYKLTKKFYEEENDNMFFENIEFLIEDSEYNAFSYNY